MYNPVIFREYDIRGVVGKDYDEAFAYDLGKALVSYLFKEKGIKNPVLSLGHDARLSSPSLADSLCKGFVDSGAHVFELGLVTSPISYFSTFTIKNISGGIMITGSHNPPEYNGFKVSVGTSTIYGENILKLKRIIEDKDFIKGEGSHKKYDIFPEYINHHKKEFGQIEDPKVVLDCGNGAAGIIVRKLYESVGLKPLILFEEPDGRFPNHHPDPTIKKNILALIAKVKETGARVGIGFDGDADRIGVVDHNGNIIYGDELMVLFGRHILKDHPGKNIIGDVKCSDRMYEDLKKHGGNPIMWKTGHSLIKEKVKAEKAPLGGELSGHIFFADRSFGYDDAPYDGLRLIEILAQTKKTIPELLTGLPHAFNTPEIRIDTTEEKKISIVKKLKSLYSKNTPDYTVNHIDGVRISYKDGWALIRSSNTQPVIVMRFESWTETGLKRIQSEIEGIVNPLL